MLCWLLAGLLCGVSIDIELPSPATEARAAVEDLILRVPPPDRPFIRYLSFYNYPIQNRIRYRRRKTTRFVLNSLSLRPDPIFSYEVPPHPVMEAITGTLVRIDIRDYKWDPARWEALAKKEPYFSGKVVDHLSWYALNQATLSSAAIMRADWFVFTVMRDPDYSAFFGLPNTLPELKALFAIDPKTAESFGLDTRGAVINSLPGLNGRQIIRTQGAIGYFWETLDILRNSDNKAVLDRPFGVHKDGGEAIWKLPNGLQAYYLVNAADNRVNEVPPGIAVDYVTLFKEKTIKNAASCIRCHAFGINTFRSDTTELIKDGKITLYSRDREKTLKLEELYSSRIYRQLRADQDSYVQAVERCTGWTVDENCRAFEEMILEYIEPPPRRGITVERAAREVGITVAELPHYAGVIAAFRQDVSGTVLAIAEGLPIKIDAWEQLFPLVAAQVFTEKHQARLKAVGLSIDPHAKIVKDATAPPTQDAPAAGQGGSP
jgi:hypothetical protein